jgi:guanylate cyclase
MTISCFCVQPFWMAPELLRRERHNHAGSDVYSFGIILYEVYSRKDPYEGEDPAEVLRLVADKSIAKRPCIPDGCPAHVQSLMNDCLVDCADQRPQFDEIDTRLKRIDSKQAEPRPSFSAFKNFHPDGPAAAQATISLFDIFPEHIAEALQEGRVVEPEHKECVTIFFSDIIGFTELASAMDPRKVAGMISRLYGKFDELTQVHDIFKVETVGDAYMATTNLVKDQESDHVKRIAEYSIDAVKAANETLIDEDDESLGYVNIRVGFHSGPVVADVVGTRNPRYCLFGDAVNIASRMESNSKANRIHCSSTSADLLMKQDPALSLKSRGMISIKGKGQMHTYWVNDNDRRMSTDRLLLSPAEEDAMLKFVNLEDGNVRPTPSGGGGLATWEEKSEEFVTEFDVVKEPVRTMSSSRASPVRGRGEMDDVPVAAPASPVRTEDTDSLGDSSASQVHDKEQTTPGVSPGTSNGTTTTLRDAADMV